jgi:nucleotide-binding universal stress UspA family protein
MSPTAEKKNTFIDPLSHGKAVVGLELARPDYPLLEYLHYLFGHLKAEEIRFVHVIPQLEFFYWEDQEEKLEVDKQILQRMEEEISAFFKAARPKASLEIREGNPLEMLLEEAGTCKASLVVIGQRGAGGHNIASKKMARRTDCPILIVPEKAESVISHMLVPIDFSPSSVKALQTAIALRRAVNPEAAITCVNIYELPDLSAYRLQRTPGELHQMVEEDRSQAFRAFLHEYAGEEAASISNSLIHKSDMSISHHITHFAKEHQCDLIVIGGKGHSRMERLVLGSVTENLLSDNEDFPILVVK